MKQERVKRPVKTRLHNESEQETQDRPWGGHGKPDLKAELDEVLADIDEALEGIEEDLVVNFRQQGGQ